MDKGYISGKYFERVWKTPIQINVDIAFFNVKMSSVIFLLNDYSYVSEISNKIPQSISSGGF